MMNTGLLLIYLFLSTFSYSVHPMSIDDFHCKIPTCRDFYFGLKNFPRRQEYEKICFKTVYALQAIPQSHGKCINDKTKTFNAQCFYALAKTISSCIDQLNDVPKSTARFYCGYTLMKYCAVHLGLEEYPLNLPS